MTRRTLLKALLFALSWLDAIALPWRAGRRGLLLAASPQPDSTVTSPAGVLSPGDVENLVAFGEALLEGRTLPPPARAHLVEFISYRTRSDPGVPLVYKMTATVLDSLSSGRFAMLDPPARTEIMVRNRLVPERGEGGGPAESLPPLQRAALAIRTFVVPDMVRGYYGSPAGWAVVDYQAFPGRCSNLVRYTRAER